MLWVVGSNGWGAVGSETIIKPEETKKLICDLRKTYHDGTPKIDPNKIKHIRIMTQRAKKAFIGDK